MKEDNNFADVTLACEDGQQLEAHKVILAGQVLLDIILQSSSHKHQQHQHHLFSSRQEAAATREPTSPNSGTGLSITVGVEGPVNLVKDRTNLRPGKLGPSLSSAQFAVSPAYWPPRKLAHGRLGTGKLRPRTEMEKHEKIAKRQIFDRKIAQMYILENAHSPSPRPKGA